MAEVESTDISNDSSTDNDRKHEIEENNCSDAISITQEQTTISNDTISAEETTNENQQAHWQNVENIHDANFDPNTCDINNNEHAESEEPSCFEHGDSEESSCYYMIINGNEIQKMSEAEFELAQKEGFEVKLQPVSTEMDIQKHLNEISSMSNHQLPAENNEEVKDRPDTAHDSPTDNRPITYIPNENELHLPVSPNTLASMHLPTNCPENLESTLSEDGLFLNLSRNIGLQQQLISSPGVFLEPDGTHQHLDSTFNPTPKTRTVTFKVPVPNYTSAQSSPIGNDHYTILPTIVPNGSNLNQSLPGAIVHTSTQQFSTSTPVINRSLHQSVHMNQPCSLLTPHPKTGQLMYVSQDGSPQLCRLPPNLTPVNRGEAQGHVMATSRIRPVSLLGDSRNDSNIMLNSSGEDISQNCSSSDGSTVSVYSSLETVSSEEISLPFFGQTDHEGREQHNQKERRRRARIKDACDVMRKLVPGMSDKTDKATVFEFGARYIHYLKSFVGTRHDKDFLIKYSPY